MMMTPEQAAREAAHHEWPHGTDINTWDLAVRMFLAGVQWQQKQEPCDDETDMSVDVRPWTDEQLAEMRTLALRGDLKSARALLQSNGYEVRERVPRVEG